MLLVIGHSSVKNSSQSENQNQNKIKTSISSILRSLYREQKLESIFVLNSRTILPK